MISRRTIILLAAAFVVGAAVGGTVGIFGFIRIVGGQRAPSQAVSAPTLVIEATSPPAQAGTITWR